MAKKETTEVAVSGGPMDLMMPSEAPSEFSKDEAGLGSEDVQSSDIVLPRVSLLQAMSKPVSEELSGSKPGGYWVTPYNRPVCKDSKETMKFVVVRIYPTQRFWKPLDEGGGLVCEAAAGNLIANEPMGLAAAKLEVSHDSGTAKTVDWVGGRPTANCSECVYGPAAAAAASGRAPTGRSNAWLPKYVDSDGERVRIPDDMRGPPCTTGLDVLGLIAMPAFEDEDSGTSLGAEIIPAFISFSRSGSAAGRSLAGMVKMAVREPAWAKIFAMGAKKVSNDKGTYFIPTVQQLGYANRSLMDAAQELYNNTRVQDFRANMEDANDASTTSASTESSPPTDDDPQPGDDF